MRAVSYRQRRSGTKIRFGMQRHVEVPSPSGALTLIWDYEDPTRSEFRVETSKGGKKRALSFPPSAAKHVKKTFLRRVVSLGWQNDDRRFFAVVELGSEEWAVVLWRLGHSRLLGAATASEGRLLAFWVRPRALWTLVFTVGARAGQRPDSLSEREKFEGE